MARLTIYVSDDFEWRVRKAAQTAGVSLSRWVADQVVRSIEAPLPREFLALAGAFPDFPDVAELRRGYGADAARERTDRRDAIRITAASRPGARGRNRRR